MRSYRPPSLSHRFCSGLIPIGLPICFGSFFIFAYPFIHTFLKKQIRNCFSPSLPLNTRINKTVSPKKIAVAITSPIRKSGISFIFYPPLLLFRISSLFSLFPLCALTPFFIHILFYLSFFNHYHPFP